MVIGADARAAHRQPVDQLVGAERGVACQQRLQHAPAHRREPLMARARRSPRHARWRRWRSARGRGRAPGMPCAGWSFGPNRLRLSNPQCSAIDADGEKPAPPYILHCSKNGSRFPALLRRPISGHLAARNEDRHVERQDRAGHRLHLRHRAGHRPRAGRGRRQRDAQRLRRQGGDREGARRAREGVRRQGALFAGRHEQARRDRRHDRRHREGVRLARRAGQQCRHPVRRQHRGFSAREMGRRHRHQSVVLVPHHPRRGARHEEAQMGPHHQHRLGARAGRQRAEGRLRRRPSTAWSA